MNFNHLKIGSWKTVFSVLLVLPASCKLKYSFFINYSFYNVEAVCAAVKKNKLDIHTMIDIDIQIFFILNLLCNLYIYNKKNNKNDQSFNSYSSAYSSSMIFYSC